MPEVSYSIEAEDLVIKRLFDALIFKQPSQTGYFVDIGAFHPILHSNTYLFYQIGWRGLNVEPNPRHIDDFRRLRPEDKTLNVGVADRPMRMTYHQFSNELLNGFFDESLVQYHISNHEEYLGSVQIECISAPDLIREHVDRDIDLLNIDIETQEVLVLGAWDWASRRPKVIAAEIQALTIDDVQRSETAKILFEHEYCLMSRVYQTSIFADRYALPS